MFKLHIANFNRETKAWMLTKFFSQYVTKFQLQKSKNRGTKCPVHAIISLYSPEDYSLLKAAELVFQHRKLSMTPFKDKETIQHEKNQQAQKSMVVAVALPQTAGDCPQKTDIDSLQSFIYSLGNVKSAVYAR